MKITNGSIASIKLSLIKIFSLFGIHSLMAIPVLNMNRRKRKIITKAMAIVNSQIPTNQKK